MVERLTSNSIDLGASLVPSQNTRALARWQVKISDSLRIRLPCHHQLPSSNITYTRISTHSRDESLTAPPKASLTPRSYSLQAVRHISHL
jgi:hypothetical protein